jgi:hypothetical protein
VGETDEVAEHPEEASDLIEESDTQEDILERQHA